MLEAGADQDIFIVLKNLLRAIAVVNIEINNGDLIDAVPGQGVGSADGNIIKKAKAHGLIAFRMVAGRANVTKSIVGLPGNQQINGLYDSASRPISRLQAVGIHGRISVQTPQTLWRQAAVKEIDISGAMDEFDPSACRQGCFVQPQEVMDTRFLQAILDGPQASGRLGVMRPHVMEEAVRMCHESRRHHKAERPWPIMTINKEGELTVNF